MADKPSRSLVLYGDGLARSVNPSHANLHSLAHRACCGFLSLPHSPHSETKDERIIRELALLLDVSTVSSNIGENLDESEPTTISERFMGMKAAIVTENPNLKTFATKIGCRVLQFSQSKNNLDLPVKIIAFELLKSLGFENGTVSEDSPFDLVIFHNEVDIEYMNGLVGEIMEIADEPMSEIGSRLHLSVLLSHGSVCEEDEDRSSFSLAQNDIQSDLLKLVPTQSYMMRGGSTRRDVREYSPILTAQWQDAVTRRDTAEMFYFSDFKKRGGNLTIPADRFLHEVAFKLWKAPKYGA